MHAVKSVLGQLMCMFCCVTLENIQSCQSLVVHTSCCRARASLSVTALCHPSGYSASMCMCVQLFCDAKREEIKAANPGASFGETGKLLAAAWKDCPAEDKARFQEQSQVCTTLCISTKQETACYHCLCCQCCILSVLCIGVKAGV